MDHVPYTHRELARSRSELASTRDDATARAEVDSILALLVDNAYDEAERALAEITRLREILPACPRCDLLRRLDAVSRVDNATRVCGPCAEDEAVRVHRGETLPTADRWPVCSVVMRTWAELATDELPKLPADDAARGDIRSLREENERLKRILDEIGEAVGLGGGTVRTDVMAILDREENAY